MTRRSVVAVVVITLVSIVLYGLVFATPAGPRSIRHFDPDRMADLELRMWQAYYSKEKARLFGLLVTMLHEQYRYPWAKATVAGFHLARAAARFGDMRSDYEQVLPDLERAYTIARDWTGDRYDPGAVARAELNWWVARRVPGQDSAEQVGARMAEEYALLYEAPRERVDRAALLRARAAHLRDQGGIDADWVTVGRLLRESYRDLRQSVSR